MPSRAWWLRNRTFIVVVLALFVVLPFLTWAFFIATGTGDGGVDVGAIGMAL